MAALLALAVFHTGQAAPFPEGPNTVVEATGPGLARLDIYLTGKAMKEPVKLALRGGEDTVVGALELPIEGPAEYKITAYDAYGMETHTGRGTIPGLAQNDRPLVLPLAPLGEGDALVVTLTRERLILDVKSDEAGYGSATVRALDPRGEPLELDPKYLRWRLTDARKLELQPDPRDAHRYEYHPKKDVMEILRFCDVGTEVFVCVPNGHCKPAPVCKDPFVSISAGGFHTCALTKAGVAFCWGSNTQGELGATTTDSCPGGGASPPCSKRPIAVVCPAGAPCRFTQISSGQTLTAAIDTNGDAWWWGRGSTTHNKVTAVLAGSSVKFSSIAAGFGHACAISSARSEIWCWGTNGYGESGLAKLAPAEVSHLAPYRVLPVSKFRKIVAGGEHTCAISQAGYDIVCWGRNDSNQTSGPSSTTYSATGTTTYFFQQFGGLTNTLDVATSADSTCVTLPWAVKCWGASGHLNVGQFGAPQVLTAGLYHVCSVANQQASCMGANNWGELGIGSLAFQGAPAPVKAPPPLYTTISAGDVHTCGLTPDGDAFCWGSNTSGQVGNGTFSFGGVREPAKVVAP